MTITIASDSQLPKGYEDTRKSKSEYIDDQHVRIDSLEDPKLGLRDLFRSEFSSMTMTVNSDSSKTKLDQATHMQHLEAIRKQGVDCYTDGNTIYVAGHGGVISSQFGGDSPLLELSQLSQEIESAPRLTDSGAMSVADIILLPHSFYGQGTLSPKMSLFKSFQNSNSGCTKLLFQCLDSPITLGSSHLTMLYDESNSRSKFTATSSIVKDGMIVGYFEHSYVTHIREDHYVVSKEKHFVGLDAMRERLSGFCSFEDVNHIGSISVTEVAKKIVVMPYKSMVRLELIEFALRQKIPPESLKTEISSLDEKISGAQLTQEIETVSKRIESTNQPPITSENASLPDDVRSWYELPCILKSLSEAKSKEECSKCLQQMISMVEKGLFLESNEDRGAYLDLNVSTLVSFFAIIMLQGTDSTVHYTKEDKLRRQYLIEAGKKIEELGLINDLDRFTDFIGDEFRDYLSVLIAAITFSVERDDSTSSNNNAFTTLVTRVKQLPSSMKKNSDVFEMILRIMSASMPENLVSNFKQEVYIDALLTDKQDSREQLKKNDFFVEFCRMYFRLPQEIQRDQSLCDYMLNKAYEGLQCSTKKTAHPVFSCLASLVYQEESDRKAYVNRSTPLLNPNGFVFSLPISEIYTLPDGKLKENLMRCFYESTDHSYCIGQITAVIQQIGVLCKGDKTSLTKAELSEQMASLDSLTDIVGQLLKKSENPPSIPTEVSLGDIAQKELLAAHKHSLDQVTDYEKLLKAYEGAHKPKSGFGFFSTKKDPYVENIRAKMIDISVIEINYAPDGDQEDSGIGLEK